MQGNVFHPSEVMRVPGSIPMDYIYTVGVAGERFFREIKDNGRFLATPCPRCGITYLPPRLYCERCFAALEQWLPVPDTGEVVAVTTGYVDLEGARLPEPVVYAAVRVDGTDGTLVHRLLEVGPGEAHIGMRVKAVFRPAESRVGSVLDIAGFRPVA